MGHHHPDMDLCYDAMIHGQLHNSARPTSSFDQKCQFPQNPSSSSSSSSSSDHQFIGNFNLNGTLSRKIACDWNPSVVGGKMETITDFPRSPQPPLMAVDPTVAVMPQPPPYWFKFPIEAAQQQQQQNVGLNVNMESTDSQAPELSYEIGDPGLEMDMGHPENQMALSVQLAVEAAGTGGERKRSSAGDEVMERRQQRMMKNRESAARSRAKKQAYTNQLEHEVRELRKANNLLKKQKNRGSIVCN